MSYLRSLRACAWCIAAITAGAGPAWAQTFTDVTGPSGIAHQHNTSGSYMMTGGAAAGDFNGDGRVDLFFTRQTGTDLLYLNQGNGTFSSAGSAAAGFTASFASSGAATADIDNDGDLDIYVTANATQRNYLYLNNGLGQFTEVAVARGADVPSSGPTMRFGSAFGDYDKDGFVDLYTTAWAAFGATPGATPSKLLRNRGAAMPGFFDDATVAAGVPLEGGPAPHPNLTGDPNHVWSFSPRFADLDRDGNPDLAIAADFGTSRLFWSNGNGTFTDGTRAAGVGTEENGMGSAVGDYNGDGLLDWFVTSVFDASTTGNRLFLNSGNRTFTDTTDTAGVRNTGWGWGAAFFDADDDGDEDLIATNGFDSDAVGDMTTLFANNANGTFTNTSPGSGIDDTDFGTGLLTLDYDGDGDLDVVVVNHYGTPVLYRNDTANNNDYLRIDLVGTLSNRLGIGAMITVDPDSTVVGDEIIREVSASTHYLAQSEITAHFGLGELAGTIDMITIEWPLGQTTVLRDVAPNQLLSVTEVPEPASVALLGLGAVAMLRRRR